MVLSLVLSRSSCDRMISERLVSWASSPSLYLRGTELDGGMRQPADEHRFMLSDLMSGYTLTIMACMPAK